MEIDDVTNQDFFFFPEENQPLDPAVPHKDSSPMAAQNDSENDSEKNTHVKLLLYIKCESR